MFRDIFLRKRFKSQSPLINYTLGVQPMDDIWVNRLAPEMLVGLPLDLLKGPGILVQRDWPTEQAPSTYQNLILPSSPMQGIPAGQLVTAGLISEDEYMAMIEPQTGEGQS